MQGKGRAGPDTTADHSQGMHTAITAVPPGYRRRLTVTVKQPRRVRRADRMVGSAAEAEIGMRLRVRPV